MTPGAFLLGLFLLYVPAIGDCSHMAGKSTSSLLMMAPPGKAPQVTHNLYCKCDFDNFGFPLDWATTDIWLDIVIILDTSEALSPDTLEDAGTFIESLLGDDDYDVLGTDHNAPFYTRVGVIAMSDVAEVLYNLNMTKTDNVRNRVSIKKGVREIDITKALISAQIMLAEGLVSEPSRMSTKQVIHFITDSHLNSNSTAIADFKSSGGIIIVNNVLKAGDQLSFDLQDLSSDGGYFAYGLYDYMFTVQQYCIANCFCTSGLVTLPWNDLDLVYYCAGGCFRPSIAGVPFSKAKQTCADSRGGYLATVHEDEKAAQLNKLMSDAVPMSSYYWIGYEKQEDGSWQWEDNSTKTYTNWGENEPSSAAVAKCAYVEKGMYDQTNTTWGAGNCQMGLPYACEYAPCSVGNKIC